MRRAAAPAAGTVLDVAAPGRVAGPLAGTASAVSPPRAAHAVSPASGSRPGSAASREQDAPRVAFAARIAGGAGGVARLGARVPRPVRFQVAGFAPDDAAPAARRAAAVRIAPFDAGAAPERAVVPDPGAAPDRSAAGPNRVEIAPCRSARGRCPPRWATTR